MDRNVDRLGTWETALDVIIRLRGALAQVRPSVRVILETVFVSPFGAPLVERRVSTFSSLHMLKGLSD